MQSRKAAEIAAGVQSLIFFQTVMLNRGAKGKGIVLFDNFINDVAVIVSMSLIVAVW